MTATTNIANRSRRWTPTAIRKATPFPKPQGEIDKIVAPTAALHVVSSAERLLLDYIVNRADRLDVSGIELNGNLHPGTTWLLVAMPPELQHLLEMVGAATEDLEQDFEGDDSDFEPDVDDEPGLGACENMSQKAWGLAQPGYPVEGEVEDEHFDDGDDEPEPVESWNAPLDWTSPEARETSVPAQAWARDFL